MAHALHAHRPGDPGERPDGRDRRCSCCSSPRTARSTRSARWRRSASACVLLAGLTLLPAMLTIGGRRAFWPRKQVVAYDPEHVVTERTGVWRRFGDRVLQRPGLRAGRDHACLLRGRRAWASSPTRRTTAPRRSSRSRPRASTASACWSARCPRARCRRRPCWSSARTDRCARRTSRPRAASPRSTQEWRR